MGISKTFNIMGGELFIYINSKKKEEEILNFIFNQIEVLVDKFNFYDPNSLLSKLNNKREIDLDIDMKFILEKSIYYYKNSNSKFNIFLGKKTKLRKNNLLSGSKINIDIDNLISFENNQIKILDSNILIDLGGIAKGYILDEVKRIALKKYGSLIIDLLLDARGDIVCYGKSNKFIEVENPFNENFKFEEINFKSGSIITSGHNKQYFKDGSHIIGNESDILTITLKSKKRNCYELDYLGTYLIQLNSEEILEKIGFENNLSDIDCLLILNNGKVLKSFYW